MKRGIRNEILYDGQGRKVKIEKKFWEGGELLRNEWMTEWIRSCLNGMGAVATATTFQRKERDREMRWYVWDNESTKFCYFSDVYKFERFARSTFCQNMYFVVLWSFLYWSFTASFS